MKNVNEESKTKELIAEAKELDSKVKKVNADLEKQIQVKKAQLEEAAVALEETVKTVVEPVVVEKKKTTAQEILELASQHMTRVAIFHQLQLKHAKLNYRYVVQTLLKAKAAGMELDVPRQERVFVPKQEQITTLEAKLDKMKQRAAQAGLEIA